jgi:hypothetical protein
LQALIQRMANLDARNPSQNSAVVLQIFRLETRVPSSRSHMFT